MKSVAFLMSLFLAGCGAPASAPDPESNLAQPVSADPAAPADTAVADDGRVECALDGSAEFARNCTIARKDGAEGRVLTIAGPDGGFRRLLVTRDGRGVVAADGSEPARVTILSPGRIEVAIGRDRYRLPATIKS